MAFKFAIKQNLGFVIEARMIAALAFVPGMDIDQVFNTLSNNIDQDLDVILGYIEDSYIGGLSKGPLSRTSFPVCPRMICVVYTIAFKTTYLVQIMP